MYYNIGLGVRGDCKLFVGEGLGFILICATEFIRAAAEY